MNKIAAFFMVLAGIVVIGIIGVIVKKLAKTPLGENSLLGVLEDVGETITAAAVLSFILVIIGLVVYTTLRYLEIVVAYHV